MLFIKLTGGPILQGQLFEICRVWGFSNVHRISKLRVWVFVEQVKSVLLPKMDQMKPKVWAGSVHSPVRRRFILAYNSRTKFGRTFGTRLHKLRYKIIS